jgi:cation diffusion facilitator family transporter
MPAAPPPEVAPLRAPDSSARQVTASIALVGGLAILASKLVAWRLTGSHAVLSDALESIVNVIAAMFALAAIRFAAQPADREHPYGHGKMEYLSAAFEGGLIAFAAAAIIFDAGRSLIEGAELRQLDLGLAVTGLAGVANLVLGGFVLRTGRKLNSPTLIADGQHILSDVWTTVGVLAGLALVRLTGLSWIDPLAALGVGFYLAWLGVKLVRGAGAELLDRGDPALLAKVVAALNVVRTPGFAGVHWLRILRHGHAIHVDAHIHVPEHWTVRQAHEAAQELERRVQEETGLEAELALHLDPCRAEPCQHCDLGHCALRARPFVNHRPLTVDEAAGPPLTAPPAQAGAAPTD